MDKNNKIANIVANLILIYAIAVPLITIVYIIYGFIIYSDLSVIAVMVYSVKKLWFIIIPHLCLIIASILYGILNKEENEDSE